MGQELARFAHHVRIELDAIHLVDLGWAAKNESTPVPPPSSSTFMPGLTAWDRRLEAVHAVLVHQHIVMIMDRDELPEVAALDFAFVQHVVPCSEPANFAGAGRLI
jgi:hypothetical protein